MPVRKSWPWQRCCIALLCSLLSSNVTWAAGENIFDDSLEGGLVCAPVAPSTVIVDVRSAVVRPVFLHNGLAFEANPAHSATFFLVPREGQPVLLGTSFDPPAAGVRVVSGVYDVEYRWRSGDRVPRNTAARVMQGVLIANDRELVIDVPSTSLRGALRMNGAPFPQVAGANAATLSLLGIHGIGSVVLGSSNQANYAVRLIPGAYDLRYQSSGVGGAIPANQDALRERHDIEITTAARDFDIPAVLAQFQFRLNGAAFPGSALENGILSLRSKEGDYVELGESRTQTATVRLIPATYDAYWEGLTGAEVPANPDSRFLRNRIVDAGLQVLDVPVIEVSGDFEFNGVAAPNGQTENGRVWLRDALTGGEVLLGETRFGSFQRRLIPASYDLVYVALTGSNVAPANPRVVFELGRDIAALPGADIDVPSATLAWQLTLNGSAFPGAQTEYGHIFTQSDADLEEIFMGGTHFLGVSGSTRRLVLGEYAPIYTRVVGSATVPHNTHAMIDGSFAVVPGGGNTQTIDVHTGSFAFDFRNNGAAFANDPARRAAFALRHRDDVVMLGTSNAGVGSRILISNVRPLADGRTATAYYTWQTGGLTEMPQNLDHPVACFVLQTP